MQELCVLIVGGGYAGIMCALLLAGKARHLRVGLVNPNRLFVERLRLHETLVGAPKYSLRSFDIEEILKRRAVEFFPGHVVSLHPGFSRLTVHSDDGTHTVLAYRRLVIASGSKTSLGKIEGQAEYSFSVDSDRGNNAAALHAALSEFPKPRVTIIGGGATGVEVAAEIAQKPDAIVKLVSSGKIASGMIDPVAKRIHSRLLAVGVELIENADVVSIQKDHISLGGGDVVHDICVSATGFEVDSLWRKSGLPTTENGRIRTDPYLRTIGVPSIYAVGDASFVVPHKSAPARMSVMYAMTSGAHVANTIIDEFAERTPRRFGFWTYGQAIGLGPAAVGFGNMRYDRAYAPYFTGRVGFHIRHFFISMLFKLLLLEARLPGFPFNFGRPVRRQQALWKTEVKKINEGT